MIHRSTVYVLRASLLLICLWSATTTAAAPPLEFHLSFDRVVSSSAFTGRVYVMLNRKETKELPSGFNWFTPEPIFARDVKDWKAGETLIVGADSLGFPTKLGALAKDVYSIQAVMDFDRGERVFSTADGNGYSEAVRMELDPGATAPVKLLINKVYRAKAFVETDQVKVVDIESKLLSEFHKRSVHLRAGVVLPKSFMSDPGKRYPVIYVIPGFTGTHHAALTAVSRNPTDVAGIEMLYVVLDPSCRHGHHVFADSENNGPCGQTLIAELIPHIEKRFRGLGTPAARFLTGHSSGGWSSLWLQVTYPDFFGGTWSTAPDPVDFRDFQKINIYRGGENMFRDAAGQPRPIARSKDKVRLYYKPFSDMEVVMAHGGQLAAFEAAFSKRGLDGQPMRLWDRNTGVIDLDVARSWEKHDIRLVLERSWKHLAPKLAGKLHIYMGADDTFYLDGATVLLKESLQQLGSDAVVEIFPGKDHSSLLDDALRDRIRKEIAGVYRRSQAK